MDLFKVDIPKTKVHKLGQTTIHKYSRTKIFESLKTQIQDGSVDQANLLSAEIICSGGYLPLWDLIIEIIAENLILILTPKVANWIIEEYKYLNTVRSKVHAELPNNQEARNHLAQIITVLCLLPKNRLHMPENEIKVTLDDKSKVLAEEYYLLSCPTGPKEELDQLQDILHYFIYHINRGQAKYCLYWIHKLIQLKKTKIRPIATFKAPKSISENPVWIIWNYIFVRVSTNLTKFLTEIINLFNIALSRKKYETATFLLFSGVLVIKYGKQIKWEEKLPSQKPICIRTCGKINFLYRYLMENKSTLI